MQQRTIRCLNKDNVITVERLDTYNQTAQNSDLGDVRNLHCHYNVTTITTISTHHKLAGNHRTRDPGSLNRGTTIIRGETITRIEINKVEADKEHRETRTIIKIETIIRTRVKIRATNRTKIKI